MADRVAEVEGVVAHRPQTGCVFVASLSARNLREAPRDRREEDGNSAQACNRGMQPRPASASGCGGPRMCAVPRSASQGRSYWIPGSWDLRIVYTDDIPCHDS